MNPPGPLAPVNFDPPNFTVGDSYAGLAFQLFDAPANGNPVNFDAGTTAIAEFLLADNSCLIVLNAANGMASVSGNAIQLAEIPAATTALFPPGRRVQFALKIVSPTGFVTTWLSGALRTQRNGAP